MEGNLCTICQQVVASTEDAASPGCMHVFHYDCLDSWFNSDVHVFPDQIEQTPAHQRCPDCRFIMRTIIHVIHDDENVNETERPTEEGQNQDAGNDGEREIADNDDFAPPEDEQVTEDETDDHVVDNHDVAVAGSNLLNGNATESDSDQ